MKTLITLSTLALTAGIAHGEPTSPGLDRPMAAPDNAFELTIGGGYLNSIGTTEHLASIVDVTGQGGSLELTAGYRISPRMRLAIYGTGFQTVGSRDGDNDGHGLSAGIKSEYHFRPFRAIDPWISSGFGWKAVWLERDGEDTALQGIEMMRFQLGCDYRLSTDFAVSPFIGISATKYLQESSSRTDGYDETEDRDLHWTFTSGVQARFDVGGARI
jgi:hypothetical protein